MSPAGEAEKTISYKVQFDPQTLRAIPSCQEDPPSWASLDFKQCKGCEWKETPNCPVAQNLAAPVAIFSDVISYEKTRVTVESSERSYTKECDAQEGLRSMFGLIMATSGCPTLAPFRLLARYHLPFSSLEETIYRISAACLLKDYFEGKKPESLKTTIIEFYQRVGKVNMGIAARLKEAKGKDSARNAVIILNCFTEMIPYGVDEELGKLQAIFQS